MVYIFFSLFHSHSKLGQLYGNIFNRFLHYKTLIFLVLGIKINVFVEMTSIVGGLRFWDTGALFSLGLRNVKARQRSDFVFYYVNQVCLHARCSSTCLKFQHSEDRGRRISVSQDQLGLYSETFSKQQNIFPGFFFGYIRYMILIMTLILCYLNILLR